MVPKNNNSTVYVVQDTHLNLAKATRYGELVTLLPDNFHVSLNGQAALRLLRQKLCDFSDQDYLLLLGDPVAIGLATVAAADASGGVVQFLKFDRELGDYLVMQADVSEGE